ncbi:HGxxPAAW family protein [Dermacoccus sp. Ellin185]|uniref:HGxxPAAW family protein n=1 Tax=Dermacoccus sp. Ellin185 TaxID=188626 RepID=UPI0001E6421F|nr:HGxxPAAW family protein [Dermacoccus sp. Ellin185]EFP59182.1 hypothetical protein HMPREF0321_1928 [Dermacoccus sp. Ellin185]
MSGESPYLDHGHSPAAWTGVGICMVGSLLIAFGVYFGNALLDIIGAVLVVVGGVVGWLMGKANRRSAAAHGSMDSERKPA